MRRRTILTGGIILLAGAAALAFGIVQTNANLDSNTTSEAKNPGRKASEDSKKYWYDGTAEISSYSLSQARYGEMREGTAVLLYVTEPFSPSSNTKADSHRDDNVQVIKLNAMKNFNTGIYPYSLMTSTFFPFEGENTSMKIGFTMQEWCGTMYSEMRNKDGALTFDLNSYFEGESFKNKKVSTKYLEDDIWTLLRLNPDELPEGEVKMVPSMSYMRMKHVPLRAYQAKALMGEGEDGQKTYTLSYPDLNRTLTITYEKEFPYSILSWEETYPDGGAVLTTKAERIKQIKSDYWNRSSNSDAYLRAKLGLE